VILRIKTILSKRENALIGISASEAARTLGMAPALAKEQLFNAENKGK
jgi:ESCRT-II complex subunit VPS36